MPREGLAHAERERGLQGMRQEGTAGQPLWADIDGFSLHAAVRVQAHDRNRLEQLCRCIARPALSDERVQLNAAGQVDLDGIADSLNPRPRATHNWHASA